jgi:hypothetical protein
MYYYYELEDHEIIRLSETRPEHTFLLKAKFPKVFEEHEKKKLAAKEENNKKEEELCQQNV